MPIHEFGHFAGRHVFQEAEIRLPILDVLESNRLEITAVERVVILPTDELPDAVAMVNHDTNRPLVPENVSANDSRRFYGHSFNLSHGVESILCQVLYSLCLSCKKGMRD